MEMLGQDPSTIYETIFSTQTGTAKSFATQGTYVGDASTDFHTYGADWESNTVTYYFDDRQIAQFPTPPLDLNKPMYLIANLAVGGKWPGSPSGTTTFPSVENIDYIRAYAKTPANAIASTTSTTTAIASPTVVGATPVPIAINVRVKTTANLNVHARAGNGGKLVGTVPSGALGTVIGGPVKSSGLTWWSVNFDSGLSGWVVQDYLTTQIVFNGTRYLAAAAIANISAELNLIENLLNQYLHVLNGIEPGTGMRP